METCMQCEKKLSHDEKALYRKIINRQAEKFLCLSCLADYFKVSEQALQEKIDFFKEIGCTLF